MNSVSDRSSPAGHQWRGEFQVVSLGWNGAGGMLVPVSAGARLISHLPDMERLVKCPSVRRQGRPAAVGGSVLIQSVQASCTMADMLPSLPGSSRVCIVQLIVVVG